MDKDDISISNDDIKKHVIPNAHKLYKSENSNIKNLSDSNNETILEEYMKNIVSNTSCNKPKYHNQPDEEKTNIHIQKLLQIIKLNELKLILQKIELLESQS